MDLIKNELITEKIRCEKLLSKYSDDNREEQLVKFSIEQDIEMADKAIGSEDYNRMNTAISLLKRHR